MSIRVRNVAEQATFNMRTHGSDLTMRNDKWQETHRDGSSNEGVGCWGRVGSVDDTR